MLGINKRQLRYWSELGLVNPYLKPSGKGIDAQFNMENLVHIYIIRELIESGLNTKTINLIMQKVRNYDFDNLSSKLLITNGKNFIELEENIPYQRINSINPIYIMRINPLYRKAVRDMELFTNQTTYKEKNYVTNRN